MMKTKGSDTSTDPMNSFRFMSEAESEDDLFDGYDDLDSHKDSSSGGDEYSERSSRTSSSTNSSKASANTTGDGVGGKGNNEERKISGARNLFLIVLFLAAIALSGVVYWVTSTEEVEDYQTQVWDTRYMVTFRFANDTLLVVFLTIIVCSRLLV